MKEDVNFIKHVNETFRRFADDSRGVSSHRMLYLALFDCWNRSYFRNTISICREEVMRIAGIGSTKTYYRCMHDLDAWGYISYLPSKSMYAGSKIVMSRFDTTDDSTGTQQRDQPVTPSLNNSNLPVVSEGKEEDLFCAEDTLEPMMSRFDSTGNQHRDQLVTPSINNSNLPAGAAGGNTENVVPAVDKTLDWLTQYDAEPEPEEAAPSRKGTYMPDREIQPPSLYEVVAYFEAKRFDARDARTFYKYYEALGWVGKRKVPIVDWRLYAECWIGHVVRSLLNGLALPRWKYGVT